MRTLITIALLLTAINFFLLGKVNSLQGRIEDLELSVKVLGESYDTVMTILEQGEL